MDAKDATNGIWVLLREKAGVARVLQRTYKAFVPPTSVLSRISERLQATTIFASEALTTKAGSTNRR